MIKVILILFCIFVVNPVHPQGDSLGQARDINTSVTNKSGNKTINTIIYATGYAAATLVCYRYFDTGIKNFAQSNQNETITDIAKAYEYLGTGTSSIVITASTGVAALITKDKRLVKTTILLVGGHVINDIVTNQVKITFQRHRPNTGDPYNTLDWRGGPKTNLSFFSAHTSNIFTTATAFATCFKKTKWVPVLAYSAAGLVGICRIYNNEHWASDVLAGAACGFASGKAMNGIYKLLSKRFSFLPEVNAGHYGITASYCIKS